jgi:hypothetical protein
MNPNDIYRTFMETGTAKAEAYYKYQQLDGQTKSILAQITLEAKDLEDVKSMAEAKDIALAASMYRDHLREVAEARLAYDIAEVKWKATEALFQAQRTVEAFERAANRAAP